MCGCGGTGRRARLRIWCPRRAGSIPVIRSLKSPKCRAFFCAENSSSFFAVLRLFNIDLIWMMGQVWYSNSCWKFIYSNRNYKLIFREKGYMMKREKRSRKQIKNDMVVRYYCMETKVDGNARKVFHSIPYRNCR